MAASRLATSLLLAVAVLLAHCAWADPCFDLQECEECVGSKEHVCHWTGDVCTSLQPPSTESFVKHGQPEACSSWTPPLRSWVPPYTCSQLTTCSSCLRTSKKESCYWTGTTCTAEKPLSGVKFLGPSQASQCESFNAPPSVHLPPPGKLEEDHFDSLGRRGVSSLHSVPENSCELAEECPDCLHKPTCFWTGLTCIGSEPLGGTKFLRHGQQEQCGSFVPVTEELDKSSEIAESGDSAEGSLLQCVKNSKIVMNAVGSFSTSLKGRSVSVGSFRTYKFQEGEHRMLHLWTSMIAPDTAIPAPKAQLQLLFEETRSAANTLMKSFLEQIKKLKHKRDLEQFLLPQMPVIALVPNSVSTDTSDFHLHKDEIVLLLAPGFTKKLSLHLSKSWTEEKKDITMDIKSVLNNEESRMINPEAEMIHNAVLPTDSSVVDLTGDRYLYSNYKHKLCFVIFAKPEAMELHIFITKSCLKEHLKQKKCSKML